MVTKYIEKSKLDKNDIKHEDKEVDKLIFNCYSINNTVLISVTGLDKDVVKWINKTDGVGIDETLALEKVSNARILFLQTEINDMQLELEVLTL